MNKIEKLYSELLNNNYSFIFFENLNTSLDNQVIIRHDIDFDVSIAYDLAIIEKQLGIKTSYFFSLIDEAYNLLSPTNIELVKKIKKLGHYVSIHFDPTKYSDVNKGLLTELQIFKTSFNIDVNIISIHRPQKIYLDSKQNLAGVNHSYESKFFTKIKYFSDANGVFRYGHPLESNEFKEKKNMQILIHPIWWYNDKLNKHEIMKQYFSEKKNFLKSHYSQNCSTFKEINDEIN